MIKSYAEKISTFLIVNEQIDNEEQEMYVYAFETMIAFFINIAVILTVGFILDRFIQTLLFLCFYCPIRQFSGGYHADNYKKCLCVFISMYLINILILETLIYWNSGDIILGATFMSYIGIWRLAPVEHRNNLLSCREKKHYKNVVICGISIVLIFILIGINFTYTYEYSLYLASVIICIFIMLVLAILKGKRRV